MPRVTPTLNTPNNLALLLAAPDAPTVALAAAGAGSVTTGTHSYAVTFVTAAGETALGSKSNIVTTDTATDGKVNISAVPIGPSGTTARKVYRTAAGGSTYKLQQTIANNTATTGVQDNTADGSLGANGPTQDTSGLDMKPPFFADLIMSAPSTNSATVYFDIANPDLSDTDNGGAIAASGSARIEGGSPVAPGDIWLYTTAAGQRIFVSGRPF